MNEEIEIKMNENVANQESEKKKKNYRNNIVIIYFLQCDNLYCLSFISSSFSLLIEMFSLLFLSPFETLCDRVFDGNIFLHRHIFASYYFSTTSLHLSHFLDIDN